MSPDALAIVILEKVGITGGRDAEDGSCFPFIKYMASSDIPAIFTALAESFEDERLGTVAAVGASIWAISPIVFD